MQMWTLIRKRETAKKKCLFGSLSNGFAFECVTLERPWVGNINEISRIPNGTYLCKRINSPKFGWTFEITGVPNRNHVLFHPLNTVEQTEGCIGIGRKEALLNGQFWLMDSKAIHNAFMKTLSGIDEFMLDIDQEGLC